MSIDNLKMICGDGHIDKTNEQKYIDDILLPFATVFVESEKLSIHKKIEKYSEDIANEEEVEKKLKIEQKRNHELLYLDILQLFDASKTLVELEQYFKMIETAQKLSKLYAEFGK